MQSIFEAVELGRSLSKEEYERLTPGLRVELVNAQFDLQSAGFSVVVLLMGDDRQSCNEVVDLLHEWMDARYMQTEVFGTPTEEERERPRFWRYWRELPPKGRIGIFLGAWALGPIARRLEREIDDEEFERRLEHARRFEAGLAENGTLVLKFWLHLSKKEHAKRLSKARKDPKRYWDVDDEDWAAYEQYDRALALGERLVRHTDRPYAPWHVIESGDDRYRNLEVATLLRDSVLERLAAAPVPAPPTAEPVVRAAAREPGPLSTIDLSQSLPDPEYDQELERFQAKLRRAQRRAREAGISSVLVFEGWDAAGKGGCIRRITRALPAVDYRVLPISAPTDEELARPYLWRFWRRLPRRGRMVIFDRSWYGRVLVERVEGFATEAEWRRAYAEINDFEEQLVEHGSVLLKFWLHIDAEEQLARFRERAKTAYKKYKLTEDDFRNRAKWEAYAEAADEMVTRTSTPAAPWHLVPAKDKRFARVQVLRALCKALARATRED